MALTLSLGCYTEEISDYGAERLAEIFHRGAPRGVVGLPSLASAEKGQQLLERTAEKIVRFVRDFSPW
jgi:creatinine amidohydrolase/Fe(II)-dependent formamide hydrolase-like protein